MMNYYDVFNGDADGIIALHQLRLAEPRPEAKLISGVKRDVRLLARLTGVTNAEITVLDISLDVNRPELVKLLETCRVRYFDHHFGGEMPVSDNLTAHIDPDPNVCTSLIVDQVLGGPYRAWAVAAAYGDNLHDSAATAATSLGLPAEKINILREIGELINYNGYGTAVDDLYFRPDQMYNALKIYADPFEFAARSSELNDLRRGYASDMDMARGQEPVSSTNFGRVFKLPAEPWARRVCGVFSNEKAREKKSMAHALLLDNNDSTYTVSVRAPLDNKSGADRLCRAFPTGGGRAGAAGINALPASSEQDFLRAFEEVFSI